ncbi:MAG: NUDIX hydrolase [Thiotrichales bacterium]|nr:NUDIX hydrolase [Thiotrichales bacterium]
MDDRRGLKALLAAYRERWPRESATVARFDAFVDSHPDCFHRACQVGHITGSAWIVDRTGDHVLLTHHRKLGRWLQPGGHSDGDPDTLAVARREAREETGIDVRVLDDAIFDIDVHRIPARGREPAHLHFDVRFLVQATHDRFRVSEESHALAWVPAADLGALTGEESVLRMARKWIARRTGGEAQPVDGRSRPVSDA